MRKGAAQDGQQKSEEQKAKLLLDRTLLESAVHLLLALQHHAAVLPAEPQAEQEPQEPSFSGNEATSVQVMQLSLGGLKPLDWSCPSLQAGRAGDAQPRRVAGCSGDSLPMPAPQLRFASARQPFPPRRS